VMSPTVRRHVGLDRPRAGGLAGFTFFCSPNWPKPARARPEKGSITGCTYLGT
jgi:hypothetical protein